MNKYIELGFDTPINFFGEKLEFTNKLFSGGEVNPCLTKPEQAYKADVLIFARIRNSQDFMTLIMLTGALRDAKVSTISLVMPYVPYARQDRKCNLGETRSLKQFAALINAQNYSNVVVFDPHSYVVENVIDNVIVQNNHFFVLQAVNILRKSKQLINFEEELESVKELKTRLVKQQLYEPAANQRIREHELVALINNCTLEDLDLTIISPDAGSLSKIFNVLGHLQANNISVDYVQADKIRDHKTMEIIKTVIHDDGSKIKDKTCVIIDDICDGGRTFAEIAAALKLLEPKKIVLVVSHGIFSYGLNALSGLVDVVISTDSFNVPEPVDGIEYHCIPMNTLINFNN
jgi:ribose-phosphate pyrophosphokinase